MLLFDKKNCHELLKGQEKNLKITTAQINFCVSQKHLHVPLRKNIFYQFLGHCSWCYLRIHKVLDYITSQRFDIFYDNLNIHVIHVSTMVFVYTQYKVQPWIQSKQLHNSLASEKYEPVYLCSFCLSFTYYLCYIWHYLYMNVPLVMYITSARIEIYIKNFKDK